MLKKLSEYEEIEGFNKTASALFKENGLSISSDNFYKFFPDQKEEINISDFLEKMEVLKGTNEFVEKLKNYNKNYPICIAGDYDVDRNICYSNHVLRSTKAWLFYNICYPKSFNRWVWKSGKFSSRKYKSA